MTASNPVERGLERLLFASRWLMVPMYLGLALGLVLLCVAFVRELIHDVPLALTQGPEVVILVVLSLIDLTLAGNLLLIVMFSGYESFVSKMDVSDQADRPEWMGTIDFSGLKLKLIASIVAISAIDLLKWFMEFGADNAEPVNPQVLMWLILLHVTFVFSGVMMALMDYISSKTARH